MVARLVFRRVRLLSRAVVITTSYYPSSLDLGLGVSKPSSSSSMLSYTLPSSDWRTLYLTTSFSKVLELSRVYLDTSGSGIMGLGSYLSIAL